MTRTQGVATAAARLLAGALLVAGCPKAPQKGGPGLPHALFTSTADFAGLPTQLDGSGSNDPAGRALTYAWHFATVPANSTVTDAAFADGTAATTSFTSDLGGEYDITLTTTAADGSVNQATQAVIVPTVPVFYATGDSDALTTSFSAAVMRSDGTGAHTLGCPNRFDFGIGATGTGDFDPGTELFATGLAGFRTYDGTLPAVAFLHLTVGSSSSTWTHQLLLGTDQSDCTGRPALRIDMAPALGDGDWQFYYPRFSPDGKRIAMLALGNTTSTTKYKVVTVGIDGGGMRAVRNFPNSNDRIIAPAWIDSSTVAWMEIVGSGSPAEFKIVRATDADAAGDTAGVTVVDCPAGTPFTALNQMDFADSSTMIFAASTIAQSSTQAGLTALFRVSAGTCSSANKLTAETTAGHFSGDFALSPDGKTVLYASTSGSVAATLPGTQLTDIFTVPVDGSAAPTRIAGEPTLPDTAPHYIAGGKQIVWTQYTMPPIVGGHATLPASASLMMANADGTNARTLLAGTNTPGEIHYVMAGGSLGNSCAIGGGTASAGALVVLAFAVALGLLRRRRAA